MINSIIIFCHNVLKKNLIQYKKKICLLPGEANITL